MITCGDVRALLNKLAQQDPTNDNHPFIVVASEELVDNPGDKSAALLLQISVMGMMAGGPQKTGEKALHFFVEVGPLSKLSRMVKNYYMELN